MYVRERERVCVCVRVCVGGGGGGGVFDIVHRMCGKNHPLTENHKIVKVKNYHNTRDMSK